jgi:hypothetical protein
VYSRWEARPDAAPATPPIPAARRGRTLLGALTAQPRTAAAQ